MKSLCKGCLLALLLSGCISTQEMPLAPNMVRIDTTAGGALFTGQTVPQTMRAAALATLRNGYTRFRFADVSSGQGSEVAGLVSNSNTTANATIFGNSAFGSADTFGSASIVHRPTAHAAATVLMLHDGDPDAASAFDAAAILKQYAS